LNCLPAVSPVQRELDALFIEHQLPPPPVPAGLAGALRRLGPWTFGTCERDSEMYNLPRFVAEALAPAAADYLLIGHDGHGVNSWALHYYLVLGPLAVFLQTLWGGVYTDNVEASGRIGGRFGLLEDLLAALDEARRFQRLPAGRRLVVVESDLHRSRWGWAGPEGATSWDETPHALMMATEALKQLSP